MEEKIIQLLTERGAMRPGEVAQATGLDKEEVARCIKQLAAEGKLCSPKRCFYDVPR